MFQIETNIPNLRHLQMVSLMVGGESLRRAANLLRVSQPSLTLALVRLEAQFGVELFSRSLPRLSPTASGAALARRVDRAFVYFWTGLLEAGVPWAVNHAAAAGSAGISAMDDAAERAPGDMARAAAEDVSWQAPGSSAGHAVVAEMTLARTEDVRDDAAIVRAGRPAGVTTGPISGTSPYRASAEQILRHLTTTQIRALDALASHAQPGDAAEALGVTMASLRRTLSQFQDVLDIPLFSDSANRRALTPQARLLAEYCRLGLREIELATDDVNDLQGLVGGLLSVGVAPVAGTVLVPVALGKMLAGASQPRLRIVSEEDDRMIADLRTGRLDFFCGTVEGDMPAELAGDVLYVGELRVLARSDHPLQSWPGEVPASELQRYPWIAPEVRSGSVLHFRQIFEAEGLVPPQPVAEVKPGEQACNLLRRSDCLSLASRPVGMDPEGLPGVQPLRRLLPDSERPVWLLWRKDARPTTLHLLFREAILDELRHA